MTTNEFVGGDPKAIAKQICHDLDASVRVLVKAEELIDTGAEEEIFSGKSPTGIAGGAVYTAGQLTNRKYTQEEVAETCDASVPTIRERYREFIEVIGFGYEWKTRLQRTKTSYWGTGTSWRNSTTDENNEEESDGEDRAGEGEVSKQRAIEEWGDEQDNIDDDDGDDDERTRDAEDRSGEDENHWAKNIREGDSDYGYDPDATTDQVREWLNQYEGADDGDDDDDDDDFVVATGDEEMARWDDLKGSGESSGGDDDGANT